MTKATIKTGIDMLDSDLTEFFKLKEQGKLEEAETILKDHQISKKIFMGLINEEVARVALALLDDETFSSIKKESAGESHDLLDEARTLAKTYLAALPNHPQVKKLLAKRAQKEKSESEEGPLSLNVINRLSPFSTYFYFDDKKLTPAIRISFFDKRKKKLLESTMDWDDLLFLINGLICVAEDEFKKSARFLEGDIIDVPDKTKIGNWIISIERHLLNLIELSKLYGISLEEIKKASEGNK